MLDRVEEYVVNVALIIEFITNGMFPIAALPDATLSFTCATR